MNGKEAWGGLGACLLIVLCGCAGGKVREGKTAGGGAPAYCSDSVQIPSKAGPGAEAAAKPAAGLETGVRFFEDFEDENYQKRWTVHWGKPVGAGTVSLPSPYVFAGNRSAYLEARKRRHPSVGLGEYVLDPAPDNAVYVRLFLRFEDGFSIGTANQLKLFAIRGGARIEDTYGGAGNKPKGTDKFSLTLGLDTWWNLHFYVYHVDQRSGWGDIVYCNTSFFRKAGLSPGKWYALQIMLKPNTPGKKDGQVAAWLDGRLVGQVDGLRFRDIDAVKVRRITVENYFGGDNVRDTSPKDQRLYIDNLVVSAGPPPCVGTAPSAGGGNTR